MNKIGWCDMTWNPVIGCKNNCSYCYARRTNQRFKFIKNWNEPEWREDSFNKKFQKKSQRIFVGSMSEIYYWREEWIERVIEKSKQYPQHTFQFLTKYPEVYAKYLWGRNCWFGVTMTKNRIIGKKFCVPTRTGLKFLSIEPLLEKIDIKYIEDFEPDWIIIGAETGNRKGKVIPNGSWIFNILDYCKNHKIPIYIKDNIVKYYSEFGGYKQFPKGVVDENN